MGGSDTTNKVQNSLLTLTFVAL